MRRKPGGSAAALSLLVLAVLSGACVREAPPLAQPESLGADDAVADAAPADLEPVRGTISSSESIPGAIVTAAKALPGVVRVGERRAGLVNLVELVGAERPLRSRPAGTILPISVEAHDPDLVAAFPGLAVEAEALRAGHAVLPRSQAEFRGLEIGDSFVLSSPARVRIRVGAVTEDEAVFRAELILPMAAADSLGLERSRAIVLAIDATAASGVEDALEEIVGEFPARIRIRFPAAGGFVSSRRLLSLAEVKTLFGEFWYRPVGGIQISVDPIWRRSNIIEARVPLLGRLQCHRKIVPLLEGAMGELQAMGMGHLVRSFAGCYSPRMQVSDDGDLSRHAFGIAVDINAAANPYGAAPTQDPRLVAVMERWGFSWGGRWNVPDGMHFEFSRFPEASPGS